MKISIQLPSFPASTELYIGQGLLKGDLLADLCKKYGREIVIISDSCLKDLYGTKLARKLNARLLEIPCGEKAKTRQIKQVIEDQMLKAGYDRNTVVIGLGGGSTSDLTGFVASTYLRGISHILIPTTLLAMVDAAIGGKTAIDTPLGKNLIGSFYHPKAVIADLDSLKTLPHKEWDNGLAEILKMGLVSDASILTKHTICNTAGHRVASDIPFYPKICEHSSFPEIPPSLEEIVIKAAKAKIAVMEQDPLEQGLRRILNFGHTIGHALETITNFDIAHGEAVAIGCLTESYLSVRLGYLHQEHYKHIEKLYQTGLGPLRLPKSYERKNLLTALLTDKKKSIQGVRFVLIDKIGHPISFEGEYCRFVTEQDLEVALSKMEHMYA